MSTMSLKVITARANPAVSLSDAKAYLRVDGSAEDTLISGLVSAGTDMVEKRTRRSLINQTFRWSFDEFPAGPVELPRSPVSAVAIGGSYAYATPRMRYIDEDGVQQTAILDTDYFPLHHLAPDPTRPGQGCGGGFRGGLWGHLRQCA